MIFKVYPRLRAALLAPALLLSAAVVAVVALLRKEILFYCFDPAMAEASGVRAAFIHYLLMLLVALTIMIGARVVGPLLMTALLVLPGASALVVTEALPATVAGSLGVGLTGTLAGLLASRRWPFLPTGPAIVLALFIAFALCYGWSRVRRA